MWKTIGSLDIRMFSKTAIFGDFLFNTMTCSKIGLSFDFSARSLKWGDRSQNFLIELVGLLKYNNILLTFREAR